MSKAAIIIPARWGSTRFPGKPLFPICGKPLLQHVWERCQKVKSADLIIIATDDERIAEAATLFGAKVAMTSAKHPTGSDRIAEVAATLPKAFQIIINVQGDEPGIPPKLVEQLVEALQKDRKLDLGTAATPLLGAEEIANPNNVKVVTARDGRALYFSRSPIPFDRDKSSAVKYWKHIGLYGYRREFLMSFIKWKPTPLEKTEKLEQLRALENGASIHVITTKYQAVGVDTPEDVGRAEAMLKKGR